MMLHLLYLMSLHLFVCLYACIFPVGDGLVCEDSNTTAFAQASVQSQLDGDDVCTECRVMP